MIIDHGPDGATATFNDARTHRFSLQRIIDPRHPDDAVCWVLLNPSTADAFKLDPTLKRCAQFSLRWGFGSMLIVNLFALRSPHPSDLVAGARIPGYPPQLRRDAIDPLDEEGLNEDDHFAVMPDELAQVCMLAGSRVGDVVLDPFGGSGTVGRVAEDLGRRWILFDLNPAYAKIAARKTAQMGLLGRTAK